MIKNRKKYIEILEKNKFPLPGKKILPNFDFFHYLPNFIKSDNLYYHGNVILEQPYGYFYLTYRGKVVFEGRVI